MSAFTQASLSNAPLVYSKPPVMGWAGAMKQPKTTGVLGYFYMKKTYLVGPDKLYKRSLDSAVSRLLALISLAYC